MITFDKFIRFLRFEAWYLPQTRWHSLTLIGNLFDCNRKWYENLPFIGDKFFRKRILRKAQRGV